MTEYKVITPSEVFKAIEYAKKTNPEDPNGYSNAFRLGLDRIKISGTTKYFPFEILRFNGSVWEFSPINLKFTNLTSVARILSPDDPKRNGISGVKLQFPADSVFQTKKKVNGEIITIDEEYGKAKIIIAEAYTFLIEDALKKKKFFTNNTKICTTIQFERVIDKNLGTKEKLASPILRMDIKFENLDKEEFDPKKKNNTQKDRIILPTAKPTCKIYNATKKIQKSNPKPGDNLEFEILKYLNTETGSEEALTYENIGKAILPGSLISGIDEMNQISISSMGISLASRAKFLIVNPSQGFKTDISNFFSLEELDSNKLESDLSSEPSETVKEVKKYEETQIINDLAN